MLRALRIFSAIPNDINALETYKVFVFYMMSIKVLRALTDSCNAYLP